MIRRRLRFTHDAFYSSLNYQYNNNNKRYFYHLLDKVSLCPPIYFELFKQRVSQQSDIIETEEATKTALIMPFIHQVLGYDVFNPAEVIPEFTADVGVKKGEKIDYAIVDNGEIAILIEAKKIGEELNEQHASQLFRYFDVLLDDNNRKPICRLHFNRTQKYIGIFNEEKIEERHPIDNLDDIFNFEEALVKTALSYDN